MAVVRPFGGLSGSVGSALDDARTMPGRRHWHGDRRIERHGPARSNAEVKTPPHERLFWRMHSKQAFAVREGHWKLVRTGQQPSELHDLAIDVG